MTTARLPAVLLPGFLLEGHRSAVEAAIAGRAAVVDADEPGALDAAWSSIQAVVTGLEDAVFDRAIEGPEVRWVHSISAGVEHLPLARMAERGIVLTNAAGAYASAMAEHALAGMIMLARRFPVWLDAQREHRWADGDVRTVLLRGKRLGIVGYGAVGREVATVARALGMEVWATKRTPIFLSGEPLDRLLSPADLRELLAACDVVVLAASLNASTRELLGAEELAVMRPDAILVNVARGGLVDEAALVEALRAGAIRGAMLDVTREEPLPADSPLWATPNLLLTPHVSGGAPESWEWGVGFFCANLALFLDGAPDRMGNLVDYAAVL